MTISQLKSGQSEDRGSTQSFLDTQLFGSELKKMGFSVFSGVPCSLLKDLINYAVGECDFQMAANEGDAIAICAGANLAGRRSVFLCQNSGLTNATSPIVSLLKPFKIPILGFVSLRGEPGCNDEPQHQLMGKITGDLLTLMDVPWSYLSTDDREAAIQLEKAVKTIERNEPYFFIFKKNTFSK